MAFGMKVTPATYDYTVYPKMVELASKASQVGNTLKLLENTLKTFEDSLESIMEHVNPNGNPTSLENIVRINLFVQSNVKTQLSMLQAIYRNFSEKLKQPWDWEEEFSTNEVVKKQQLQEIFNIQMYRCLTSFLIDLKGFKPPMPSDLLDDTKMKPIINISERLRNERVKHLSVNYTTSPQEIIKTENRPTSLLPLYIERIMYRLYYSKDVEGVFRLCAAKSSIEQYIKYIGVIDFRMTDYVLVGGIIKKIMRDMKKPIWPIELFEDLIAITQDHSDIDWVTNFKTLYEPIQQENKAFLEGLIALCLKIIENPTSKMDFNSLAICVGPAVIRTERSLKDLKTQFVIEAFEKMLRNAKQIFTDLETFFIQSLYDDVMYPPTTYKETFTGMAVVGQVRHSKRNGGRKLSLCQPKMSWSAISKV
ncbi:hypothetical protein EIN_057700 [Entamoeba invadens IP1]|uniref:hypothetical protein n=1 Tax=Entamoeba invadens IP1 TaxID=370355 RepID=UPI0002C3CF25|nr:hypothetical protein EIN_057700 [Entamoeba invadens IP1]ELP93365.1 hypothetical protein EIN_057700 [Entamoeba invadens IP1]|eukprot:XP_004260136.1 hypothetical protein EIN_057700 [Entamoeba invadens IP1]